MWTVITTIGYGDFYIRATLLRIVIITTGLSGILLTSLFVFVSINVLKMNQMEDTAYNLSKNTILRAAKDQVANDMVSHVLSVCLSNVKNSDNKRFYHRRKLLKYFEEFEQLNEAYKLACDSKTGHIMTKASRLKFKLERIFKATAPDPTAQKQINESRLVLNTSGVMDCSANSYMGPRGI